MEGMLVRMPMIGEAARSSSRSAPAPVGNGCRHKKRPQAWRVRSSGPGPSGRSLRRRWIVPLLILVPRRPRTAGNKVRVAANTATTDSMIPKAMLRKAGLGTSKMAAKEASTVRALKATAFPAVSIVSATEATMASRSPEMTARRLSANRNRITKKRA